MKTKKLILTTFSCLSLTVSMNSQTLPSYVPSNGLIAWWPFNGNANDVSGNGNNGTLNNGPLLSTDRFGNSNSAFSFDGVNDNISATPPLPTGSSARSVSSWFRTTASYIPTSQYPQIQNITGYGNPLSGAVIFPQQVLAPSGKAYFESGSSANQLFSSNLVNDGNWHLIVTTYNGPGTRVKMYIDGVIQDSSNNVNLGTVNSFFCIGNASWANVPFQGEIDDVGIWNRELTSAEVLDLYVLCILSFSTQPTNQLATISSSAQFSVGSSDPSASYQWQTDTGLGFQNLSNAGQYSGVTSNTLNVNSVTLSNNNQQFRCVINSGTCSDTSDVAVLNVCGAINNQPTNQNLPIASNAQFSVSSTDPAATFQWQTNVGLGFQNLSNAGQYTGSTNDTLTVNTISLSNNNQQFRCIINSGSCLDTSDVVSLTVYDNTGVNEFRLLEEIIIFPNPAKNEISVSLHKNLVGKLFSITDINGKQLFQRRIEEEIFQVDIKDLPSGVYFCNISGNKNQSFRVIKD